MPVPDNYLVEPNKGKKYFPIPADKYQVQIFDVEAIRELNFQGTEDVDKLNFTFVVLDDKKVQSEDENGQPQEESTRGRRLWRKIPRSFSPGGKFKASLFYELMCAIEKKQLSQEELVAVNPNSLIGQQLCVFVSINKEWNNVESFLKADKDLDPLPTVLDKETGAESPSTANPSNPDEFIKGLEADKAEELLNA